MPDLPAARAKAAPYDRGPDPRTESAPDDPFIVNPPRGDARNWLQKISRIFAPSGNRNAVRTTDDSFQEQRAPLRIPRLLTTGRGLTGPNINIVPDTGSWAFIPGQDISLKSYGKATPALRLSDDAVTIPAIYAGTPPQG